MTAVRTERYCYDLPKELIAQYPLERGRDRLLIADKKTRRIEHQRFEDLGDYLTPDDLLVFNDTRVIPARLIGKKKPAER